MIYILKKLFLKNAQDTSDPKVRQAYGVLCGLVGIGLNIILFIGKFFAGTISGSVSITADAVNNLSDAGSSVLTLIGFRMAGSKPDLEHPFGHGRIEYVSGLAVAAAILLMAFELIKSSVDKILHPQAVDFSLLTLIILVASIVVKVYMYIYNHSIGKQIDSATMRATATDSLSDACATLVVLVAMVVSHFTELQVDGYCGVLVALFIFYAGINAAKETLNPLLGQPPEKQFVERIETLVMMHSEVLGIHDLIVHDYGPGRRMISLHAEVPAEGDILELHDMIDNIERELQGELHCDAVIHMDPVVTKDEQIVTLKEKLSVVVKEIDEAISMHDFRVVIGPTHTNLIFDIVVPFGYPLGDDQLKEQIGASVRSTFGEEYYCVIQVDKDYAKG